MIKDAVVLVVDDERDHADGMAEALRKCCDKAIPVYTGREIGRASCRERVYVLV